MKVAIVTEGFQGTGYGHLTRCLSIYQAFEEKGIQPLYIANCDEEGKKFISNVNLLQVNWLGKSDELINNIKNFDITVIDSYLATLELYKRVYKAVKKVVYIDDYIRIDYPPGVIINGTVGAESLPYKKDDKHEYLLGIDYMPLRKEFWDVEVPERDGVVKNVLITFGAQDLRNITPRVLTILLKKFPYYDYYVVGSKISAENIPKENVNYYDSVNAERMLELMLKTDLAVTAAGQTTYELARLGIRTIAIGVVDNQKYNLKGWKKVSFIEEDIWYDDMMLLEKIERIIRKVSNYHTSFLFDGQGARRLIEYVLH